VLSYHCIEHYLRNTPAELSEIALELRNLVASVAPNATEEIKRGGFVYYFGKLGGPVSAGICGIKFMPDHVRLYFTHGAFIPDPKRLLSGTGKAMRFVRLDNYETVPWDDIKALIEEHANFDPRSFRIS
jgi:hypothetical protein